MNKNRQLDPKLYLILGGRDCGARRPADIVSAAVKGGVTLLQLREKTASTEAFLRLARDLQAILTPHQIPLLINDRIDIALAAGTAGIHIGQDDMPVTDARRLLGPDAIIGLTVRSLKEAEAAPLDLVNYISIGGVFKTTSKDNTNPPIGIEGFTEIAAYLHQQTTMPITAIAGINAANTADVIRAGADGVAVISAVCAAADPQQASHDLRTLIDTTLAERTARGEGPA